MYLQAEQPVGVVDHQRAAVAEIEVARELAADARQVAVDLRRR